MPTKKRVSILGVTGSIGQNTADVILAHPDLFEVDVVTAGNNPEKLADMAQKLNAKQAIIANSQAEPALADLLEGSGIQALSGKSALKNAINPDTDITVSAITGLAGLPPLMHALRHSRAVAIANKEPLVAAGQLVMAEARKHNCRILPLDSEHNAIFQIYDFERPEGVSRVILTASGGPFLRWSHEKTRQVTPEQALQHPTWSMGPKISVDSATMMNKALEIIEAHILFELPAEKISVLIHPQSVVHSLVEYSDGSVLAQMGASDMRTPIAHVLGWPDRIETPGRKLNLQTLSALSFEEPDMNQFPALRLAYECLERGPAACLAFNAANEVAVEFFLKNDLDFHGILRVIEYMMQNVPDTLLDSLEVIEATDAAIREEAKNYIMTGRIRTSSADAKRG
ncbi:MAG: 1-deoxy-D-xylulose-5-phosphate reductoisomerase [Alphaproteobacteria bacterium]|nr:1-deoxy-D-xylulose-5-phosphate reductoisomerase [Alphaproteobacteria bacterium]